MAEALGQTITVMNKSGKVVSTSKHLANVFKEAKEAYLGRKAEIKAGREDHLLVADSDDKRKHKSSKDKNSRDRRSSGERRSSRPRRDYELESERRRRHSRDRDDRRTYHRRESDRYDDPSSRPRRRPSVDRVYTDSLVERSSSGTPRDRPRPMSVHAGARRHQEYLAPEQASYAVSTDLARRYSFDETSAGVRDHAAHLSLSERSSFDSDLAYGDISEQRPSQSPSLPPKRKVSEREQIRRKATTLQRILEEANCVQYSAKTTIKSLESNPEAMAAVGLTLAEISTLVSRAGPRALLSLRTAFPAVAALLLSPEFLVAAGVGVGITVVAMGGYKIVKKTKANKTIEGETAAEEAQEASDDVSRVESWRRGVVIDPETASVAESVEAELITPRAASQLREQSTAGDLEDDSNSSEATAARKDMKAAQKRLRDAEREMKQAKQQVRDAKHREDKKDPGRSSKDKEMRNSSGDKDAKHSSSSGLMRLLDKGVDMVTDRKKKEPHD